jgi:hypothetical protein
MNSVESNRQTSTIDNLLQITDEEQLNNSQHINEDTDIAPITKHTVVTSPWSRLLVIAVPFGVGFLVIFLVLNSIFNPNQSEFKVADSTQTSSSALDKVDEKDGDVYAKLALSEQEKDLSRINTTKDEEEPEPVTNQTEKVVSSNPPAPRTISSPRPVQSTPKSINRMPPSPTPVRNFVTPSSAIPLTRNVKTLDPTSEFERLRNIGSFGQIAYADTSITESAPLMTAVNDPGLKQTQIVEEPDNAEINSKSTLVTPQENTTDTIEKIFPRWQVEAKASKPVNLANNYLPQENQILQEKPTRYLTVGTFGHGVLITPVVKQQTDKDERQQTDDGRRFVAKLTQDLHDNNGDIAIESGSLLAVEVISVDGGSYAQMQVTSIIKDKTEYPISKGAISVQGNGGKPLIAKKFQDKGGEIAQYDLTVGLVGGLAKVGEIINQPDSQTSIQNSSIGGFSSSVTQNNRRNIPGAFLEGAFGKLTDIIGDRAERSTEEILARPNVWYIPQGTKVTFIVNRTLELP